MADGEAVDAVMREWAKGHDAICAERLTTIRADQALIRGDIKDLKDTINVFSKVAIGVVLAMLGWLAVQVYDRVSNPPEHFKPAAESRR